MALTPGCAQAWLEAPALPGTVAGKDRGFWQQLDGIRSGLRLCAQWPQSRDLAAPALPPPPALHSLRAPGPTSELPRAPPATLTAGDHGRPQLGWKEVARRRQWVGSQFVASEPSRVCPCAGPVGPPVRKRPPPASGDEGAMVWESGQAGEGPDAGRVKECCLEEEAIKSWFSGT